MPRSARVLLDNGYYHIVTRGIDRRRLFRYKQDYLYFLKVTRTSLEKFQVSIVHYCLMPNHIHLLLFARKAEDVPRFIQIVLQVYAGHFRGKYKSVGFVFQNRYKSRLIDRENYLLDCARYIERNPLRAQITDDIRTYPWSSHSFYASGEKSAIITTVNPLYLALADTEVERQRRYVSYVSQERPYEHLIDKEFRIR